MSGIIKWRGKIGYGDIISPICFAHNQAIRTQENITLKFYFEHTLGQKFKDSDAETINDRVAFITNNTVSSGKVEVEQVYNYTLKVNHTNYFDHPISYHNLGFSEAYAWKGNSDHIAVIPSTKNKKQFSDYATGKMWKDTMSGNWDNYINALSLEHSVEQIHYETPIKEASEILASAKFVIGYHGSAAWLARWIGAPMLLISDKKFTEEVFPWCIHSNTPMKFTDEMCSISLNKKAEVLINLERYLNDIYRI